jgi:hypothetical protein
MLTIAESALTVDAGGSVALPIHVTPSTGGDDTTVTITGLMSYESLTDHLDGKTFTGASVMLTAAEVNSGLSLASNLDPTLAAAQPVNTLSVTTSEAFGQHVLTSATQAIVVTDPPNKHSMGAFHVSGGKIYDPTGAVFFAKGINVRPDAMWGSWGAQYIPNATDAANILSQFPGLNIIRFALTSGCVARPAEGVAITYQQVDPFIQYMTSHHVVVEIEDHMSWGTTGVSNLPTGTQLTTEYNWYTSYASYYKNNPYVWFGTMNEPHDDTAANTVNQEVSTYNAIRSAGNNNPIMLQDAWGTSGFPTASSYASMTNVIWDLHFYPNHASTTAVDQTTFNNDVAAKINSIQTVTSADGVVPVFVGEYGPATTGGGRDVNYSQDIYAIQTGIASMTCGNTGYEWSGTGGSPTAGDCMSTLPSSQGALTTLYPWGQEMATYIHTGVTKAF